MKRKLLMALAVGLLTATAFAATTATAATATGGMSCTISGTNAENMAQVIGNGSSVPVNTNVWLGVKASGQVTAYEWWLSDGVQGNTLQPVTRDHWDYRLWANRTFTFTVKVTGPSGSGTCTFVVSGGNAQPGPGVSSSVCSSGRIWDDNSPEPKREMGSTAPVGTHLLIGWRSPLPGVTSYTWYVTSSGRNNLPREVQPGRTGPDLEYTLVGPDMIGDTKVFEVVLQPGNVRCSWSIVATGPKPATCPKGTKKDKARSTHDRAVCIERLVIHKPAPSTRCPKGTKKNSKASKPGVLVCERTRVVRAGSPAYTP